MSAMLSRVGVLPAAALSCLLIAPLDVAGQAWVAPKGEGAVTVAVQNMNVDKHLAGTTDVLGGHIDTFAMVVDTTYGLSDRLSLDFAVPYIASKYVGPTPHPGSNRDNGRFHGTFADIRVAVRYNVTRRGVVFTPYVGTTTPSHDYVFYAHAAPGPRLKEFQIGAFAAKLFDRGIPNLFVSGRYSFGVVEKVLDIRPNRSTADLEVGYFVSPRLRGFVMTSGQISHGGLDFPTNGPPGLAPQYRPVHDQIQKVHFVKVGGGVSYAVTDGFDVFGSFTRQVAGRNGHALNRGITVGASWGFSLRKQKPPADLAGAARAQGTVASKREGSLIRCICQKS